MERASSLATAAAGVFLALGLVLALVLLSLRAAQDTAPTAQAEATAREPAPFALEKTARDAARTPLEPVVEPGAERPAASLDPGTPFDPRRLLGVVVASDGSPVPGARILLFSREILSWDEIRVPAARAETQSDEDGRFAFSDLEALSRVSLLVLAEGFLPQEEMHAVVGRHDRIELVRAQAFAGRVLDAATRAPLAGVTIELYETGFDGERLVYPLVATTDREGGYSFSSGRLDSSMALHLSMGSCLAVSRSLRLEAGCADGYDFFVRAPRSIAFTVVDAETGQPFADEEVFIDDAKLRTDWQGRVSVDVLDLPPAGSNPAEQIEASAAGTCITSIDVRVPSEPDGAVVLPLLRSGRIELHVRDAGGSPLPGAHAYCREVKMTPRTPPPFRAGASIKERISDESDQDGILTVDAPPENSLTLDVGGREGASARVAVDVPAAGATIAREVILLRGATIEGRVKHGSAPVPRAIVTCEHAAYGHTRRSGAADNGSYRFEHVPPGTVWLRAHVDESFVSTAARTDELQVEDGEELHYDIEVAAFTATIEGVVRSSSGRPFAATLVYATSYFKVGNRTQVRRSRATTDAGGRFSLNVADESGVDYFLWVEAGMMHAKASRVPPGARGVELVIPEAAAIALRVVDARTDVPVNGAQLYWRRTGTSDFVGVVDPSSGRDGAIRLELPLGLCDVRARAPHLGYAYGELLAAPVAAQGEPRVWTIALSPGARLDIRFEPWDPAWAGRVDATLLVPREAFAGLDGDDEFWSDEAWEMGRLEPDATGTCRLRELAAGRYSFWEPPEGVRLEPSEIVVPPSALGGAPLEVVVRWSELDDEGRSR
jgi:hypothetical protein